MLINAFKNLFTLKATKTALKKGIRRRLELLGLEERVVPANITVLNDSDSGTGSLRQAILDANATVANDTIDFNFSSGTNPYTITLAAALPNIVAASTAGTLTINGLGASSLIIDANGGNFSIFTIDTGANLTISGLTVSGANNSVNSGGAFFNNGTLTVSNSTISGNTARSGGGINNDNGTLTVSNSTISGNFTPGYGAGINNNNGTLNITNSTISGNTNTLRRGGGIYNRGTGTVTNSTLSGNSAVTGGGVFNGSNGTLSVTNSTLSGNSAVTGVGGGISNRGNLNITSSTLSGNSAVNGGGIYNRTTLNISNTIIANSTSGGDYAGNNNATVNVTSPSTAANNLVSQGTFSWATTKTSVEINLGTLANNGGPTQTLALLTGSVAIGAGDATISNAAPVNGLDQRGVTRSTTAPSIGAYEATAPTPTPTPTPTAPLITGTPTPPSFSGASTVNLYDAVTGQPTGTAVPFPGFTGSIHVASGDFNNDGVADIFAAAGFGGGPAIAILDSQTGEVMEAFFAFDPAFTGGVFIAVQDANGDGILDIIAAAGPGGGPEVRIFNGANFNVLRSFFAYDQAFSGGVSVASVDFNNDGILDIVTGAGPGGAPHVKVFDGATDAIISQWYAYADFHDDEEENIPFSSGSSSIIFIDLENEPNPDTDFTGGVFVAAGDIGNNGTFEVVTGAGPGRAPVVAVWNPFTGGLLAKFMAYAEDFTGGVSVAVNDGNSDGIADIITGAGPGGGPQVNVYNFRALDLLLSFYSGDPANTGGVFVG